jgi:hypothetical protein
VLGLISPLAVRRTLAVVSDDNAYERVTNPERCATLHQAAHELVVDLRRPFDVLVVPVAPGKATTCTSR